MARSTPRRRPGTTKGRPTPATQPAVVDRRPLAGSLEDVGIVLGAMAIVTLIAELAGAANFGTALGIGQVGFGLALIYVLARRG